MGRRTDGGALRAGKLQTKLKFLCEFYVQIQEGKACYLLYSAFFRVFSRVEVDFWVEFSSNLTKLSRFDAISGRKLPVREERIEKCVD